MIEAGLQGSVILGRAGEVALTLGLSLGAAMWLRRLRSALAAHRAGLRGPVSLTGPLAISGLLTIISLCVYLSFDGIALIRRSAAILSIVLTGLTLGILSERSGLRPSKGEDPISIEDEHDHEGV